MDSTRLPGKVLMDLAGEPMLVRVVDRTRRAESVDETLVATTTEQADAVISELCDRRGYPCFRGSSGDVLDRYYQAALKYTADAVLRVTADNPIVDPMVIDDVVAAFNKARPDCASNDIPPRTYPLGLGVEVVSMAALRRAWSESRDPASREHVTFYIIEHPEQFRLLAVKNPTDCSALRWTVDTAEDLAFVRKVYDHFGHDRFTWLDALALVEAHPQWRELNRNVQQKVV
jgi:spore coat polysaccharide biosynthesis protein SpsF